MCGQLCGYLKNRFVKRLQHMAQNSFVMDAIDCEAMQVAPTPTAVASLAINIMLKTTQTFLTTS